MLKATSNLAFGSYSFNGVDSTAVFAVTCTNRTPYTIGMETGMCFGAPVSLRKMTSGVNALDYILYSASGKIYILENTPGPNTVAGIGNGIGQSVTV